MDENLTIDKLIEKEAKYIQSFQAEWQVRLKKAFLENGVNSLGGIAAKEGLQDFSEKIVNKTVKLGMRWLKKDA